MLSDEMTGKQWSSHPRNTHISVINLVALRRGWEMLAEALGWLWSGIRRGCILSF